MAGSTHAASSKEAWLLAARQHGVISRRDLLELGYSSRAVEHRIATGRLHLVERGVYAVRRPELTLEGRWMAASWPVATARHSAIAARRRCGGSGQSRKAGRK
jgi:hypothetical protein